MPLAWGSDFIRAADRHGREAWTNELAEHPDWLDKVRVVGDDDCHVAGVTESIEQHVRRQAHV